PQRRLPTWQDSPPTCSTARQGCSAKHALRKRGGSIVIAISSHSFPPTCQAGLATMASSPPPPSSFTRGRRRESISRHPSPLAVDVFATQAAGRGNNLSRYRSASPGGDLNSKHGVTWQSASTIP